jgi:Transposase
VDEIYLGKRDQFLTVVSDLETGEPLWVGRERKRETLDRFFAEAFPPEQRPTIRAVCMDMEPSAQSVRTHLPQARIVYDKFHVLRHVSEAVEGGGDINALHPRSFTASAPPPAVPPASTTLHPRWSRRHSAHDRPPRAPPLPRRVTGMLRRRTLLVSGAGSTWTGWIGTDDAWRCPRGGVRRGSRGSHQDAGGAGPGLCSDSERPTCARIFRITTGSCRVAISRSRPPQCGHTSTSSANARSIKAAHAQYRGRAAPAPRSGPSAGSGAEPVSGAAARPYATTRLRHRARAASRPWHSSRFASGRGVTAS